MRSILDTPTRVTKSSPDAPVISATVIDDAASGTTAVLVLNRHTSETVDLDVELRGLGKQRKLVEATEIHHPNLKAANTCEAPNTVAPRPTQDITVNGERITARLKPLSWTLIATQASDRERA